MASYTNPLAVQRLPSSVLSHVADHLTGLDAVNFGRVCRAWVEPALRAIYREIKVTLPRNYGEAAEMQEKVSWKIADYLAYQAGVHMEFDVSGDARTQAARCARLRQKAEGALAALYARPERIRAVRKVTMSYEAGPFGVALLSVVRQHLQSLEILPPSRMLKDFSGSYPVSPGLSIWLSIPGLLSSSATFGVLQSLSLQVDETVNDEELQALLRLTGNLRDLTINIRGNLSLYVDTSDVRDQLRTVRSLSIICSPDTRYNQLPTMATSLLLACLDVTRLTVVTRNDEDQYSGPDYLYEEDNELMATVKKLKRLQSLTGTETALRYSPYWKGPPQLERITLLLDRGSRISLWDGEFVEFVPELAKLRELHLVARGHTEAELVALCERSNSIRPLSEEEIECFDSAPLLRTIKVVLDTSSDIIPWKQIEILNLTTLRQQGSTGPYLYWTTRLVRRLREASSDKDAPVRLMWPAGDATSFEGRAIPLHVLQKMAEIQGVRAFGGRDIEVTSRAWAELEAYMASGDIEEDN